MESMVPVLVVFSMALSLAFGIKDGYSASPFGLQYKMVSKAATWNKALTICEQEGGRLAMPKNLEQHDYLLNTIGGTESQYWIGVKYVNGTFKYVDGCNFVLELWEEDEPDRSNDQACVAVKKGEMYDRKCNGDRPFICEAELVCHSKPAPSYSLVKNAGGTAYSSCGASRTTSTSWGTASVFSGGNYYCYSSHYEVPLYIWYEFPAPALFVPGIVSFYPNPSYSGYYPVDYQFVGSNDKKCSKDGVWEVLGEVNHNDHSSHSQQHFERSYCKADAKLVQPFRCVGIKVKNSVDWGSNNYIAIKDLRFWQKNC